MQNTLETVTHIPHKQSPNKSTHLLLLICGDVEKNPDPKLNLLLNHPQIHQEKHNIYFYKNTIQIKIEYEHILELFKPYLNHTHTENTNPYLKQFCINNQQHLHNYIFYAILITLAPTPTQCNQLISKNSTHWTLTLLNKIINSFITTERPNIETLLQKFPYLPDKLATEALKYLHPLSNFTIPNPT
jgi:hypothetical protein